MRLHSQFSNWAIRYGSATALVASLIGCASPVSRTPDITESAMSAVKEYSARVLAKDFDGVAELTHPKIVDLVGSRAEVRRAIAEFGTSNNWPVNETIGEIVLCSVDNNEMALVNTTRTLRFFQGSKNQAHKYVLTSNNKGRTWSFIDQSCTTADTARKLLPQISTSACGGKNIDDWFNAIASDK